MRPGLPRRHRRPRAPTPARPGPLTRRQYQVAELIGQGLSNRQIAHRLVIAQRTVEGHVEQIMIRLGVASRTRIAAWVSRAA